MGSTRGSTEFEKRAQRIELLTLEVDAIADPASRAAATALVEAVMDLHGEAFARVVDLAEDHGIVGALTSDDLLSSMLLLYDLHPVPLQTRVEGALEKVKSYLESHGGSAELARIEGGVVHLRLSGTCKSCPSSSRTMKLAVEQAILDVAPEISAVVADDATHEGANMPARWEEMPAMHGLAEGSGRSIEIGGRSLFVCRVGESVYAYGNACAECGQPLAAAIDGAAATCSQCSRRYDIRAAGRALDEPSVLHLESFPLLVENGRARVALPA